MLKTKKYILQKMLVFIVTLEILQNCQLEPALADAPLDETLQYERLGYFCPDTTSTPDKLVFNRTVGLRDVWARMQKQAANSKGR